MKDDTKTELKENYPRYEKTPSNLDEKVTTFVGQPKPPRYNQPVGEKTGRILCNKSIN